MSWGGDRAPRRGGARSGGQDRSMAAVSSSVDTGFQPTEATAQAVSPMTTTSPTDRLRCPAWRHPVAQVVVGSQLSSSKMCSSAALMAVCCGRVSVGMGRLKVAAARSRAGAARLKPRKLAGASLSGTRWWARWVWRWWWSWCSPVSRGEWCAGQRWGAVNRVRVGGQPRRAGGARSRVFGPRAAASLIGPKRSLGLRSSASVWVDRSGPRPIRLRPLLTVKGE